MCSELARSVKKIEACHDIDRCPLCTFPSIVIIIDRFEKLPKVSQQQVKQNAARQQQLQQERIAQQQASAKNRRLAAQMANRPSVKMALGGAGDSAGAGVSQV